MDNVSYNDLLLAYYDIMDILTEEYVEIDSFNTDNEIQIHARVFVKSIITKLLTISKLQPSVATIDGKGLWDYFSLGILARAVVEEYYLFWYLFLDSKDEEKLAFRFRYYRFRGESKRLELFKLNPNLSGRIQEKDLALQQEERELKQSKYYKETNKEFSISAIRKAYLRNPVFEKSLKKRFENNMEMSHMLLSQYSHNTGLAYSQMKNFKNEDNDHNRKMFAAIMVHVIEFLPPFSMYIIELFPEIKKYTKKLEKFFEKHSKQMGAE